MKYLLLFLFLLAATACRKTTTISQRDRELSEPLLENQIIEDGAIRLKLEYSAGQIHLEGPGLEMTQAYVNYYIEDMPDNTERIIKAHYLSGSGNTFSLLAEGFTASTSTKRFQLRDLPILTGVQDFLKVKKGVVKYTFTKL